MSEDLPTLERPMKATSGWLGSGRVAILTAPNAIEKIRLSKNEQKILR